MRIQFGKRIRSFLGLEDTPASYAGQATKVAKVNAGEDALEFGAPGVGTFLGLTDTPASYEGQAGKYPKVNAGEDALEFAAVVGEGDISWLRYKKIGRYHLPMIPYTSSGKAILADNLYAIPFYLPISMTFDRIAIGVQALGAGNARLGVYADDGSIYPGSLSFDAGTVDVSATGDKAIIIDQTLAAGLYHVVVLPSVNFTIFGTMSLTFPAPIGRTNPSVNCPGYFVVAQAYNGLPASFPAGATETYNAFIPAVYLRRSA